MHNYPYVDEAENMLPLSRLARTMPVRVGGNVLRSTLVSLALTTVASLILFAGSVHAAPVGSADDSGGDTLEQFVKKCKAVDAFKERSGDMHSAEGFKAGFDFGQCVGYI